MSAPDKDHLNKLTNEVLGRLLEDEAFDLEGFLREHPGSAAGIRSRLDRLRAAGMLPGASFTTPVERESADAGAGPRAYEELLEELRRKPALHERYEELQEIGQGGMGRVVAVFDRELRRRLAMKVLRTPSGAAARGEMLARFLEEARITGQLNHQGIVPIHDLGLTEDGSLYYTMRLIEGRQTLSKVFELAREGREGWTRMRALDAILRACEAVAYAHQRGVIHRDLKPGNIMVGPLGEVFVVDWGLSRVLEAAPRERSGDLPGLAALESERGQGDSPYLTVQGQTLGTPYYMSPEQARGDRDAVDARSDVYSMGAVLYEFLTGRPPYAAESAAASSRELVERIVAGPPRAIAEAAPDEPAELVAICAKALQRRPEERYPSITELAGDLRAFTEGRVVAAYETGAWAEARNWVRRNKLLSGALAAVVLAVVAGGVAFAIKAREATAAATLAQHNEAKAEARADDVLRLSALQDLEDLLTEADDLWPAHPGRIGALRAWVVKADALVAELPRYRAQREELRALALPQTPEERRHERESHPDLPRLSSLQGELTARRAALLQRRDGVRAELPDVDWGSRPEDAEVLNRLAWRLVDPKRTTFGREAEGLVLAQRALELAGDDPALRSMIGDTLACALFALGRDEEALHASAAALDVAPEERRAEFEGYLMELEAAVQAASSEEGLRAAGAELTRLEGELAVLQAKMAERQDWRFPEEHAEARWWDAQLTKLIEGLEALQQPATGLLSSGGVSPEHGWSIARRLAFAQQLEAGFAESGEYAEVWAQALPAIRKAYPELNLTPQMGLLPIGPDPESGLWEFAHLVTGLPAERGANGKLKLTEETGVVLVLLPGGTFWMGAQSTDPDGQNYDPQAERGEGPPHEVELSAFFVSKYELTQGQWRRLTGSNPSQCGPEGAWSLQWLASRASPSLLHPVEQVSWEGCMKWLPRAGLVLPSEAQWEYGARAGTETPWWPGADLASLEGVANVSDAYSREHGGIRWSLWDADLDDGCTRHACVGTFRANAFGLHDVHGNVNEWCLDGWEGWFYAWSRRVDPVAPWVGAGLVVYRGGSFLFAARFARSSQRFMDPPGLYAFFGGVRPARAIER